MSSALLPPPGQTSGGADTTIFAAVSPTNLGYQNAQALRNAFSAAAVAAAAGKRPLITGPAGKMALDYVGHTLLTADVVLSSTVPFTINCKDTSQYGASGSVKLTDRALSNVVAARAVATITYTGKTGTTLTGCTCNAGANGTTAKVGDMLSIAGTDEQQVIATCTTSNVQFELDVEWDMTDTVAYDQGTQGPGYGPVAMSFGTTAQIDDTVSGLAKRTWLKSNLYRTAMWLDAGEVDQPNTGGVYGNGTGGAQGKYVTGDWVHLGTHLTTGYDRGHFDGEMQRIADPGDFSNLLSQPVVDGTDAVITMATAGTLANRCMADPNNTATTVTADAGGKLTLAAVTALTLRSRWNDDMWPIQSGLLLIGDPTGTYEVVYFNDVDYDAGTVTVPQRGLLGTAQQAWPNTTPIRVIEGAWIDKGLATEELVLYSASPQGQTLTVRKRGAGGTTAQAHALYAVVTPYTPPGRLWLRRPIRGDYPRGARRPLPSTLNTAVGGTYTEGTQETWEVKDLTTWPTRGLAVCGSEKISYADRDDGKLYGVTRNVDGTALATHAAGAAITYFAPTVAVGAAGAIATGSIPVAGAFAIAVTNSGAATGSPSVGHIEPVIVQNLIRVDDEVIRLGSGFSNLVRAVVSGSTLPKLNAGITAADTTIALQAGHAVNLPTAGCGAIANEGIQWNGIVGDTLQNVKRGYMTLPRTHNSGDSLSCITALTPTAATGRAYARTTAATHAAGALVRQVFGVWIQKVTTVQRITGRLGHFIGETNYLPRHLPDANLGSGAGGKQAALTFSYGVDCHVEFSATHTERHGLTWENCIDCTARARLNGVNRQGFGNGIDHLGACEDIETWVQARNCRHAAICSSDPSSGNPHRAGMQRGIRIHIQGHDFINAAYESQDASEDVDVEIEAQSTNTLVLINNAWTTVHGTLRDGQSYAVQAANFMRRPARLKVDIDTDNCKTGLWLFLEATCGWGRLGTYELDVRSKDATANDVLVDAQFNNKQALVPRIPGVKLRGRRTGGRSAGAGDPVRLISTSGATIDGYKADGCVPGTTPINATDQEDLTIIGAQAKFRGSSTSSGIVVAGDRVIVACSRVTGSTNANPIDTTGATNVQAGLNQT